MENVNMLWSIGLSITSVVLGVLGTFIVALYHFYDMQKRKAEEDQVNCLRQDDQKRVHLESGQWIVHSVNSNNNSPRLGDNLTALSLHLEQLGIELNVDVNGCVENAK